MKNKSSANKMRADEVVIESLVNEHGFEWVLKNVGGMAADRSFYLNEKAGNAKTKKEAMIFSLGERVYDKITRDVDKLNEYISRQDIY